MKNALIVIDVQNYFAIEKAADLPQRIAWHIEEGGHDYVLFTKFRNDPESNFHKQLHFHDVTESPATDLHPAIASYSNEENTFEKTTYSALKSKELRAFLEKNQITEIDLCGISLDACVLATAYEAFDLGYKVNILENLCSVSSVREDLEPAALTIINRDLRQRDFRIKR